MSYNAYFMTKQNDYIKATHPDLKLKEALKNMAKVMFLIYCLQYSLFYKSVYWVIFWSVYVWLESRINNISHKTFMFKDSQAHKA